MTKLKVGDRVRSGQYPQYGDMTVVGFSNGTWDADGDNGMKGAFEDFELQSIDSEAYELATLRAFRDNAIALYPDLAQETDERAANRFQDEYYNGVYEEPYDLVISAIAWARANPR